MIQMLDQADFENKENIAVCVVGIGRIGLPTATVFAEAGYNVVGVDINTSVVDLLNQGKSHLTDEPGLIELVEKVVKSKKLRATSDINEAVKSSDVIIVCVPTLLDNTNNPNYSAIKSVSESISKNMKEDSLIIVESTIGPSAIEGIIVPILNKSGKKFYIAAAPERVNPGSILRDLKNGDRIIGGIDKQTTDIVASFYATVNNKIMKVSNPKTANAAKLTENIFRNVNIALMNELAILYEKLGIDAFEVIKACSTKWNFVPHYPGPGVGGPCIPVNPYYLIEDARKFGENLNLVELATKINSGMPKHVVDLVLVSLQKAGKDIKQANIAVLGLSYKANVAASDISPSKFIVDILEENGANIKLYDPYVKSFGKYTVEKTLEEALSNSDCVIFVTDHDEFKKIDFSAVKKIVGNPCSIIDCKGMFNSQNIVSNGMNYSGVGKPNTE